MRAGDLGIGIVNPQAKPVTVHIQYIDAEGSYAAGLQLRSGRHVSKLLPELLPLPSSEVLSGTLDFSSELPFSVTAVKIANQQLEALPAEHDVRGGEPGGRGPPRFSCLIEIGWRPKAASTSSPPEASRWQ
jgi:hypothetical protein